MSSLPSPIARDGAKPAGACVQNAIFAGFISACLFFVSLSSDGAIAHVKHDYDYWSYVVFRMGSLMGLIFTSFFFGAWVARGG